MPTSPVCASGTALRSLWALAWVLAVLAPPAPGAGQSTYWSTQSVLSDFFPRADRVRYVQRTLDEPTASLIAQRLGYRVARTDWTVFVALTGDTVSGYAVIDDELGQHEPITFAVRMDPAGVIDRVEIMVYREHYGEEVRDERFRRQFHGRDWTDPMRLGHEIVAVSGATISSRALSIGARRASAVVVALLEQSGGALTPP